MSTRFKLSVNDILEKHFHVDFKGYSAQEVDEYLDLIIHDYEEYERMIQELGERLKEFENKTRELQKQLFESSKDITEENPSSQMIPDVDVLKRISRLEEEVFKNR